MAPSNDKNSLEPVFAAIARWFVRTKPVVAVKMAMRAVWKWWIQTRLQVSMRKFIREHDKYVNRQEQLRALRRYRQSPESIAEALDLARFWTLVRRALSEVDSDPPEGPGSKIVDLSKRLDAVTRRRLAAQEQERTARREQAGQRAWKNRYRTGRSYAVAPFYGGGHRHLV